MCIFAGLSSAIAEEFGGEEDDIVKVAQYRNEIRNQVDWAEGVGDNDHHQNPCIPRGLRSTQGKKIAP